MAFDAVADDEGYFGSAGADEIDDSDGGTSHYVIDLNVRTATV
jgi:hypothetical protein